MTNSPGGSADAKDRLSALRRAELLDTQPEPEFDRVTRLLSRLLDTNVSLLSLVDQDRQFFKSSCGLPEPWAQRRETPLSHSFCQHVVTTEKCLVVEDARAHPLVAANLAVRDLGVIAYLGVPVRAPGGHILGSLCAIDSKPRTWSVADIVLVEDMASVIEHEIALRDYGRRAADLARENSLLAQEYHHRVKNVLAVAASLVALSARGAATPREVVKVAQARLCALADAHDTLKYVSDSVGLETLAGRLMQPYVESGGNIEIDGPEIPLQATQITPICLFLHELATNAVKYGAFGHDGSVDLRWHTEDRDVVMKWNERAPSIGEQNAAGFGSSLLQTAAQALGGRVNSAWKRGHMQMSLTFPVADATGQV